MTMFDNKVLLSETKSGTMVMLDARNGKELWSKMLGNPAFSLMYGDIGTFTKTIVAEEAVYLAVFEGQHKKIKGLAGYSALLALDAKTGNELWRYQEDDYIFYAPAIIDGRMITVNQNSIKAYNGGPNKMNTASTINNNAITEPVKKAEPSQSTEASPNPFEGQWSTPGSDELAIKVTITDNKNGVITYYIEGEENPVPFNMSFVTDTKTS